MITILNKLAIGISPSSFHHSLKRITLLNDLFDADLDRMNGTKKTNP